MDADGEPREIKRGYSVGSYGPFPISFYSVGDKISYIPQEHDECGPFKTLQEATNHAKYEFGATDGGFHDSLEEAQKHADWMKSQGYEVEW